MIDRAVIELEGVISRFIVKQDPMKTAKDFAREIFKTLKKNMVKKYELHAYGRKDIIVCKEVSEILKRWISVLDIESGPFMLEDKVDLYMVVHFERNSDFYGAYKISKSKANRMCENWEYLREQ